MTVTRVSFAVPKVGDAVTVIVERINGWRHRVRGRTERAGGWSVNRGKHG